VILNKPGAGGMIAAQSSHRDAERLHNPDGQFRPRYR
jgi:hypothetical protein